MKLKPSGNLVSVEVYSDTKGIILPDSATPGKIFRILDIGFGWLNDDGGYTPLPYRIGDLVAIEGKVLTIPFDGNDYLIARADDIIAFARVKIFRYSCSCSL